MYNVLIADDEQAVYKGLSIIIDWEKFGFKVINTAEDGGDALDKLKNDRYNLVITDIRMPVMNGLELIKSIKIQNPSIKILVISGHSDFFYAKQAIEYGVKGYLLKPVDRDDLIKYIMKIKEELDNEFINKKFIRENVNIAKDKLLSDFVYGSISEKEIYEKMSGYEINIMRDYYCVALIEINGFNNMVENNLEDANLTKFSVRNIVEEIINENQLGFVYEDTYGVIGILFCREILGIKRENIITILDYIDSTIRQYLKIETIIGCGDIVNSASCLKDSRRQALYAMQKRMIFSGNGVASYDYIIKSSEKCILEMKWDTQKLLSAIEMVDIKNIETEINNFIGEMIRHQITKDIMQAILYNFILAICSIVRKYNGDVSRIFNQQEIYYLENNSMGIEQLKDWLSAKCNEICDYILELQKDKSSNIINQVKTYIDDNYYEDLSLKSISGIFYLSPAYLGRLFKNITGEAFSDYLNKIRITKVKKMILCEDSKVYEIITKVGYNNHEHFYRQFKRYEGVSFADYKKNIRNT